MSVCSTARLAARHNLYWRSYSWFGSPRMAEEFCRPVLMLHLAWEEHQMVASPILLAGMGVVLRPGGGP